MTIRKGKVIVLGVHSFVDGCIKVGSQYIAEGLAKRGWSVDYVSVPSSPFDVLDRQRRSRLSRVWGDRQDEHGVAINAGLTEYAFRTPFPAHKWFLRSRRQMHEFCRWAPGWLRSSRYDICINDVSPNVLFLPLIAADCHVLRLNDSVEGFSHSLHRLVIEHFRELIAQPAYDEIWAVSDPLAEYALKLNSDNRVVVLPNGVEQCLLSANDTRRIPRSAVYLGSVSKWVNVELLEQTALLLPDWQFYIYGPRDGFVVRDGRNLRHCEPISREEVSDVLAVCEVGLIPFRELSERMKFVERPLKFYEYVAAGLGVASTNVGRLKRGMGQLASYGNTPEEFASAIQEARHAARGRSLSFNQEFVDMYSWDVVMDEACKRIEGLRGRAARKERREYP